jgi:hypothetical protein
VVAIWLQVYVTNGIDGTQRQEASVIFPVRWKQPPLQAATIGL